jgi:hypothetical protein
VHVCWKQAFHHDKKQKCQIFDFSAAAAAAVVDFSANQTEHALPCFHGHLSLAMG